MSDSSAAGPSSRAPHSLPPTVPTSSVISRIEKELRDLWAPPLTSLPATAPTARACTMNLVVVADSKQLADRYTAVVDEVAASIPCRAILVALEPDTIESKLDGDAVKVCPPNESLLCSERVRLVASGQVVDRIGSAVEALCVPEIPTALVWLGRVHVDDPVFLSISRDVQRVILDTEYTSLNSLVALARLARTNHDKVKGATASADRGSEVADLAWTRLSTWQELCARFFDSPALIHAAEGVTEVAIVQASDAGTRLGSEAALLVGWLATRLGWTSARVGGQLRFKRRDGGDVRVKLSSVPRPQEVAPAALAGVRLTAEKDGILLKGSIDRDLASGPAGEGSDLISTRDADMLHWKLEVQGQPPLEQNVRLGANKGAKLLERTLHRPACDDVLLESIAFAERVFDDAAITG